MDFIYDGNKYLIGKNFSIVNETVCLLGLLYVFGFFWPPFWPMRISSFYGLNFLFEKHIVFLKDHNYMKYAWYSFNTYFVYVVIYERFWSNEEEKLFDKVL